jgi:hypothetical protein
MGGMATAGIAFVQLSLRLTLAISMRMIPLLVLASILSLTWYGCVFQPDENFVDVDPEPKAVLSDAILTSVDLMTMPDTFEIFTRKPTFTARLQFDNAVMIDSEVSIDNYGINTTAPHISFGLDAAYYTEGYHTIRIRAITNTGTGSIADVSSAELVEWERNWTFLIHRVTPPALKITKVAPSDGKLRIEFEPSSLPTQRQLDIEWNSSNNAYSYIGKKWSYTINDPAQTSIVDDLFVEGSLRVTLTNLSIDPEFPSGTSIVETSFDNTPRITFYELDGHGKVMAKCNRSLFYNNVREYRLTVDDITYRNANTDTTFEITGLSVGFNYNAQLRTYAARLKSGSDTVRLQLSTPPRISVGEFIGHSLEIATWSLDHPELGFAFDRDKEDIDVLQGADVVRSFSVDTLDAQFDWTIGISRDGQFYYFEHGNKVYKMDRNGNTEKVLDARALLTTSHNIGRVTVGDRYVAFYAATSSGANRTIALYDLQTGTLVDQLTGIIAYRLMLSPDGKYLAVWNDTSDDITLYSTDGGNLELKKTFPYTMAEQDFSFTRFGTPRLMVGAVDKLIFYDPVTDQSEIKMYPYAIRSSSYRILNQDPVTGMLSWITNDFLYIIDPLTGEFLRTLPNNSTLAFYTLYDKDLYRDSWKYDCKF